MDKSWKNNNTLSKLREARNYFPSTKTIRQLFHGDPKYFAKAAEILQGWYSNEDAQFINRQDFFDRADIEDLLDAATNPKKRKIVAKAYFSDPADVEMYVGEDEDEDEDETKEISAEDKIRTNPKEYLTFNKETQRWNYGGTARGFEAIINSLVRTGEFSIPFGVWDGDFDCRDCNLTSLNGAPQEVTGNFWCSDNQLTSLKGAPRTVGGYFWCDRNRLISLEGAPQKVGDDFRCEKNQLTSLEGAPQKVGGSFFCFNNQLTSLKGAPREVRGTFYCRKNPGYPFKQRKQKPL